MLFLNSNIPSKIIYSFNDFETLRLTGNTVDHLTFIMLLNELLETRKPKDGYQSIAN